MSWTDERVELLGRLWQDGLSASQIAGQLGLGVTRNAVIGKVHRLGLASRAKPAPVPTRSKIKTTQRPPAEEQPKTEIFYNNVVTPLPVAAKPAVVATQQSAADVVIPFSERVTIMELRESSCRWPIGDPSNAAEFRFCGARTGLAGGPYCMAHARMAFQPMPDRRRERVERFARIA